MRCTLGLAVVCGLMMILGCGGEEAPAGAAPELPAMPFVRVPSGGDDPGENGPDDSTELDGVWGAMGKVVFSHFTHASNKESGYGIPCRACHHTAPEGEDPSEGCGDCHRSPSYEADPAHAGPWDDMRLAGDDQDLAATPAVPFTHFTHASTRGYKIACATCHHKDNRLVSCSECHGVTSRMEEGQVVPKLKRAFHLQCKGCHEALKMNQPDSPAPVACEECHNTGAGPQRLTGSLSRERAFHLSCINCHQGVRAARPDSAAPVKCAGCHEDGEAKLPGDIPPEPPKPKPAPPKPAPAADGGVDDGAPTEAPAGEDKGREQFVIDHAAAAKSGTPFNHWKHQNMGVGCDKCHHKGLEDPTCRTCHADSAGAKKAYHSACIPCHKESGAPAGCSDCHPK